MKDIKEEKVIAYYFANGYFSHSEIKPDNTARLTINVDGTSFTFDSEEIDELREFLNYIKAKQQ